MSEIALTVSVLALVAVVGLWIGNVKIRGVGFGIGGVLFGGIIVGHFVDQAGHPQQPDAAFYSGIRLDPVCLHHRYSGGAGLFRLAAGLWPAAQSVRYSYRYPRRPGDRGAA